MSPDPNIREGWLRDAGGALRRETIPSMLRRMVGWDYRARAIYQITITLADRSGGPLGRLVVKGPAGWVGVGTAKGSGLKPEAVEARVVASAFGEALAGALAELPRRFPQVSVLASQLMPEHFHFIVFVREPIEKPLGALVRGVKAGAVKRWKEIYAAENGGARDYAENSRARDYAVNARCVPAGSPAGVPVWSEGFQDTILFREGQLSNMFRYLADNPRRRAIKALCPDLFKVVDELVVPLALGSGPSPAHGRFSALGNRFLLDRPLAQVQVSRSDFGYRRECRPDGSLKIVRDAKGEPVVDFETPAYGEKKAQLFAVAAHGAVLISPCVSDGERQIAREALAHRLPLVTMHNKGFSKLQKPSGRYFDACADGRLLMLAPAAWPYQPGEKPMTRFDAVAMNRLCQWIVGEDAADVNYHGMKPANIDALARDAALINRG